MSLKAIFLILLLLLCEAAFGQQWQQEQQLVEQLNASRAEAGLPPLKVDPRLTEAAREHSRRMLDQRTLGHVLKNENGVAERLAATGLHFDRSGENVGYNSDFNGLHEAWMHSPPHRVNILSPGYTLVGIGVVRGNDGVYWATQDFAHPIAQLSNAEAANKVAESIRSLREQSSREPIRRADVPAIQQLACSMGRSGKSDPKQVLSLPGVHYAVTYSNPQFSEVPKSAHDAAQQKSVTKFAVGVCEISDESNPGGTYYVVLAFY